MNISKLTVNDGVKDTFFHMNYRVRKQKYYTATEGEKQFAYNPPSLLEHI